jgi:hypothetical protein
MKAIETITGRVSVLNRDDVDTDQIIPKQFLKRVARAGFGEFLFYDWAKQPGRAAGRRLGRPNRPERRRRRTQPLGVDLLRAVDAADPRAVLRDRRKDPRYLRSPPC